MSSPPPRRLVADLPLWELPPLPWASFHPASTHARTPQKLLLLNSATSCLFSLSGEQLLLGPCETTDEFPDFPLRVLAALLRQQFPHSVYDLRIPPDDPDAWTETMGNFADSLVVVGLYAEPAHYPVLSCT